MPSNSSQSTALQRVPSAKEAKEGCIQLKPLKVVPTNTEEANEDEFLALPKDATVTLAVAGQTRSSSLPAAAPVLVAAPLSHLYHSQLNVQVEFANKVTYRGSISVDVVKEVWSKISPKIPDAAKKKEALLLLIPAVFSIMVPLTVACLVVSPLVIGFCLLFFPIMIPLVVGICLFVLATVVGTGAIMSGIYFSSRYGRNQLATWWQSQTTLQEYWNVLRGPRFGLQTFYYATGPRPTPVTITRTQLPKERWRRLGVSLTIDGVGSFSYLLPFLGEAFDVVWAPAQTVLIMALYQHVSPNMSYVSFAEEMLPFLDVLPSATTGWLMEFGPELLEEAKGLVENPKQLQMVLWGNNNDSGSRPSSTSTTPRSGNASRRPLPTGRPSRH